MCGKNPLPRFRLGKHFDVHPVVFPAAAVIVVTLVAACFVLAGPGLSSALFGIRDWIAEQFGWLYVASMSFFVGFAAWLAMGRYGGIRLGHDNEQPEFSRLSWFSMLFSAGMGIGLLFFSVAEPIYHFQSPPPGFPEGLNASRLAMAVTIFHWGLHPWALYAIVGLAIAYFGFRRDMPLSFRSLLHPLLGDRVWGRTGDAIDTMAIIATLTGVATSLGIGAKQVNAGLSFLFGIGGGTAIQIFLIAAITAVATISVVLGLDAGIRRLSELNIGLAGILMLLLVVGGGVTAFLNSSIANLGGYLQILPLNSFRTGAFSAEGRTWVSSWTVFYWAWWISWSPFVGMFVARVSRGRTIREFVCGVVLVPTLVCVLWLTAFGATTLRQHTQLQNRATAQTQTPGHGKALTSEELLGSSDSLSIAAKQDLPTYWVGEEDTEGHLKRRDDSTFVREERPLSAVGYLESPIVTADGVTRIDTLPTVLFVLLDGLFESPWLINIAVGIATLCIILFFVTSSDSASMVIDIIASGGNPDPPVGTRLFWATTEGVVAAALLYAGGLEALQAAAITAALPFTVVLLMACVSLLIALSKETLPRTPERSHAGPASDSKNAT